MPPRGASHRCVPSIPCDGQSIEPGAVLTLFWSRRGRDGTRPCAERPRGLRSRSGWMTARTRRLPPTGGLNTLLQRTSQERKRAMEPGRFDRLVSRCKTADTSRPKYGCFIGVDFSVQREYSFTCQEPHMDDPLTTGVSQETCENVQKWRSRNQMGNLKYRASTGQTPTAHRQPDDKNVEFR
jgi:hypothetical protein